jgi:hypothetical protein
MDSVSHVLLPEDQRPKSDQNLPRRKASILQMD